MRNLPRRLSGDGRESFGSPGGASSPTAADPVASVADMTADVAVEVAADEGADEGADVAADVAEARR